MNKNELDWVNKPNKQPRKNAKIGTRCQINGNQNRDGDVYHQIPIGEIVVTIEKPDLNMVDVSCDDLDQYVYLNDLELVKDE